MIFPFSCMIFFFTLMLGTLISISSPSWFGAWVGLELNMMSFIPLISLKMNSYYSEAALKYFLIQALSSSLIISSSLLMISFLFISSVFIFLALLLKLASAPFHFWFPQVMEGLNWPQVFILSTIQKLAPMVLLSYLLTNPVLLKIALFSAILSAVSGALGGLNSLHLRKIIAFSSINHLSWMIIAITLSDIFWIFYFLTYSFILLSITSSFSKLQVFLLSSLSYSQYSSVPNLILLSFTLLSLGGLPPFTGFIPKWLMIQIMVNLKMFLPLFFLLLSALITLYFYLRIVIMSFILLNPIFSFNTKHTPSSNHSFSIPIKMPFNFVGIILPIYMFFL
uniref:NADH-ubiquinone oxidoreductase chain 2 n=1 Tax=Ilyoplax deschampsi TaxID=78102 RepID=K9K1S6_9EUCA|nr:NADH dehydrogenase subunit 2 [Ilyoplax deschampsi]AEH05081.1 NADH dehydrogenase subunit 2 [Ilyoplax deschampsi]